VRIELKSSFLEFTPLRSKSIVIFFLLVSAAAFAADDDLAYCKYLNEQAAAERDRLRTPNAIMGFTQPSSALPMQFEFGLTASLANVRKASLTVDVARRNCEVYKATADARMRVQYALPALERGVLRHRLELLGQAFRDLEQLMAADMKKVEAQNLTRPALYSLEAARLRLSADRAATSIGISSTFVPEVSSTPIRELVQSKLEQDRRAQQSVARLERQNDWDLSFTTGAHHQLTPWSEGRLGAYGVLSLSYNLAHSSIGRHLANATEAYERWKHVQQDDVANAAEMLRRQLAEMTQVQQAQLDILSAEDRRLDEELARLSGIESNAAIGYRSQVTADQLVLRVDLGDIRFRLETLRAFIHENL
jgi:hypothetical protein